MKKISVVVPVYNVEKYLDKCLQSLVNQNSDNYEIIVIDDGSTDKSKLIINKYLEEYPNLIKSYYKKNGGLSSARNYGIKKASGEFLLFIDSDDYVEKNMIKRLLEILDKSETDIIEFNIKSLYNFGQVIYSAFNKDIIDKNKRFIVGLPSACNKLIKRSLFVDNKLSFTENIYYEDLMLIPKLALYTDRITFIDDCFYNYFVRNESIMNSEKFNDHMLDIFDICNDLYNSFGENYYSEVEYLYIEHLLRNAGIRFVNYKAYHLINKIKCELKDKFPNWKHNIYFKKYYGFKSKILCYLLYNKQFLIMNILRKLK